MHTMETHAAFIQGYAASVRSDNPVNPYFADTQADLYGAWVDGVDTHRKDAGTQEYFAQRETEAFEFPNCGEPYF